MNASRDVNCYCFNKDCKVSIFQTEDCMVTKVTLDKALSENVYCLNCSHELVSQPVLEIKLKLKELLINTSPSSDVLKTEPAKQRRIVVDRQKIICQ